MTKIFCDICGVEIFYFPQQAVRFPEIKCSIIYGLHKKKDFDLCSACQSKLLRQFEFYKKEEENII